MYVKRFYKEKQRHPLTWQPSKRVRSFAVFMQRQRWREVECVQGKQRSAFRNRGWSFEAPLSVWKATYDDQKRCTDEESTKPEGTPHARDCSRCSTASASNGDGWG